MPFYIAGGNKAGWTDNFQAIDNVGRPFSVGFDMDYSGYDEKDDRIYPGRLLISEDALEIEERASGLAHLYVLSDDFTKVKLIQSGVNCCKEHDIEAPDEAVLSEQLQAAAQTAAMRYESFKLVRFYRGELPINQGSYIKDIWKLDRMTLENRHDYIQWLFPTLEPSRFNRSAPILDEDVIRCFRENKALSTLLDTSFKVMLDFLGLSQDEHGISAGGDSRDLHWVTKGNHNFMRLTRMLESLRVLGKESEALQLFRCLRIVFFQNQAIIDSATFFYWDDAMMKKLP